MEGKGPQARDTLTGGLVDHLERHDRLIAGCGGAENLTAQRDVSQVVKGKRGGVDGSHGRSLPLVPFAPFEPSLPAQPIMRPPVAITAKHNINTINVLRNNLSFMTIVSRRCRCRGAPRRRRQRTAMSTLAPIMEGFFTERLIGQRQASAHTVASYRDAFRLLLAFLQRRVGKAPSKLALEDLDAVVIGAFLDHLEAERHNSVRTRNKPPRRHPLAVRLRGAASP